MKAFPRLGLVRRLALGCAVGVLANIGSPAQALMPWTGEGPCSALAAAANVAWQCDFRDYQQMASPRSDYAALAANPGHSAGLVDIDALIDASATAGDPSPATPAVEPGAHEPELSGAPLPYDWQASSVCGPTDWSDASPAADAPTLSHACAALGKLVTSPALAPVAWDRVQALAAQLNRLRRLDAPQVETAQSGARAGAQALTAAAAGRLSGLLGAVGRQCLGASAALDRVVSDQQSKPAHVTPTAWRPWRPQPSANPFGHLGL